jgi:hypothetical protein
MLREIQNVKHIPGQGARRWFNDEHIDLFVWYDAGGGILGFQLCFDKDTPGERALTFTEAAGYSLDYVVTEASVCDMGSPMLVRGGEFSRQQLLDQLGCRGEVLERPLYEYIREKLEECPALPPGEASEAASRP